ncbi:doublecortin domain-containing protein 2B isoform X2 [Ahaetulla prasina]|uniref:doublecortin domain-containing protein 2B isoform X2 n=1 Tax=Ahaetulla prasina TaxID=499056 RepID=UPI00264A3BE1|nr:doublecortin domain-containing protein 2B isoform X2 [Ahaetulla prasina]
MDSRADVSASRTEGCSAPFLGRCYEYLQKRGVAATDTPKSFTKRRALPLYFLVGPALWKRHSSPLRRQPGTLRRVVLFGCRSPQGAFSDKQRGVRSPGEMVSGTVAVAPLAKNVVVFRNGDPFFLGRKFVVSQRRFLTFDAFLNEVTSTIQAPVAVRSIYTPREGHRIVELSELQNGCRYVAAGFERFKRLDYANAGMKQLNKHQKKNGTQNYPGIPQKMMVTVGWKRQTNLPCVIYVFRNGDLLSPPFRMVLARSVLQEWGIVLGRLSEKANLRTGAVKKLCKLNGDLISRGEELVNGEYYVAVGLEKYKDLPYFELLVPPKIPHRPFRNFPSNRRRSCNRGVVCEDGASDSALLEPAQQLKLWRVHSTGIVPARDPPSPPESKPAKKYPHQDKVTSVFHAKPSQVGQVNQVPGNYSARESCRDCGRGSYIKDQRRAVQEATEEKLSWIGEVTLM